MVLALVGAGKWGQNYLRAVKKIPDIKIKYVCSGIKSLQSLSPEYVKVENYKDLVEKKDVDGIIIATPASNHYELAEFFLKANKPILIEKPMVTSLSQAKKLKDIFERKKSKILVGHIFLYNPAFQRFTELLGEIGSIQYLNFEGCDFGPIRDDVSALWDWSPHDISMCLEIMKKMPLEISAWAVKALCSKTDKYDMVYARLLFEDNTSAFLKIGWLSPFKKREILVFGSGASILFDDTSDKKIIRYDNLGNSLGKVSYPSYSENEPLVEELLDFIGLIRGNRRPKSDFLKSFEVVRVIDAIGKSIKLNGNTVKV